MLWAAADRLHRSPHIFVARHQIPARGQKLPSLDPAALIDLAQPPGKTVPHGISPGDIPVTLDHGVCLAQLEDLLREQRGMDAAINDPRTA